MRLKSLHVYMFTCLTLLAACDPSMRRVDELKTETIAVHDEVMPRMGELNTLSVELKKHMRNGEADTLESDRQTNEEIMEMVKHLDEAYDGMMDWMAEYETDFETLHSADSTIAYYSNQKKLISEVKVNTETSISNAEKWLAAHAE